MSESYLGIKHLSGFHSSNGTASKLSAAYLDILKQGLHGISFSLYLDGQKPGDVISEAQIGERLEIVRPYTQWIRTFSCSGGNELIPGLAKARGLKTMVGAWLEDDEQSNEVELAKLVEIAQEGSADILAVGNEVLYRKEMALDKLIEKIHWVKAQVPYAKVGYVDAYYEFCNHPELTAACDVVLANCYPFWEGCHADYALLYIKDMFHRVRAAAGGKPIVISETGWPNAGECFGDSEPSDANAMRYFVNVQQWANEESIDMFYFSSFDESWKTGDEGDVGAYWGLWDSQGQLKFVN